MGIQTIPAAGGGKTMYQVSLTSGTSWTVPAGVTYINACLIGGGGGGSAGNSTSGYNYGSQGGGGQMIWSTFNTTPGASINYSIGAGGAGATGSTANSSSGGTTTMTGATSASGGSYTIRGDGQGGAQPTNQNGALANNGGLGNTAGATGGTGGNGQINIEYWL